MLFAAVTAVALATSPPLVTTEGVTLDESGKAPFFGVQLDVGAPDGIGASLVITPGRFLRIHAGGLTNGVGSGVRAGAMLMAFPTFAFRPFIGVDGGYVAGGVGAWLPQLLTDSSLRNAITGVNVAFANAQVGFELGSKNVAITLRAGLSYIDLGANNQSITTGANSSVTVSGIAVRGFIPSARFGFIFNFG
jgi:hypothetical protein